MIPIEFFWAVLILIFGIIGAARGLGKELGATSILCLSLFALWLGWDKAGSMLVSLVQRGPFARLSGTDIRALYFGVTIVFVAFISYEGIVLEFPVKLKGILKWMFGFLGGLLNGYLVVGTVWNVVAQAAYFLPTLTVVSPSFSNFHNTVVKYLPVSIMDNFSPFPILATGMLLLLAIVFK